MFRIENPNIRKIWPKFGKSELREKLTEERRQWQGFGRERGFPRGLFRGLDPKVESRLLVILTI